MNSTGTVVSALHELADRTPDRLFAIVGDHPRSASELVERARMLGAGLQAAGVARGDRIAILATNRVELLDLFVACPLVGAIQVPLNAFLKGEFLRYQLHDCSPTMLLTDAAGFAAARPLLAGLPELRRIVVLDDLEDKSPDPRLIGFDEIIADGDTVAAHDAVGPDDIMSIIYTSGTTGFPKGCVLTQGYYMRIGGVGATTYDLRPDDRIITALPLFHAAARMLAIAAALRTGASVVVEPEFHASWFLRRAAETKATVMLGAAAMARMLLAQPPSEFDRAHMLRLGVWTPADTELQRLTHARFGFDINTQLYGQTECVGVSYSPASSSRNGASAGRPAPDLELRLVDDDEMEVPCGAVGEIVIRPHHRHVMFREYWRKPEATLDAFRGLWYHTGDYGRMEDDGSVFFVDRKKDAMRRRGENVSSMELEAAITEHPNIAEVAVHAVPSAMTEDDIKACVVLIDDAPLEPAELFRFFCDNLPYFAVPRYVEVFDELPKNAVSRVMKHMLRARGVTPTTWDFVKLGLEQPREARRRGASDVQSSSDG